MKEVIERLNWLAYKCEDKAITPDVKDDVKYALEEIERLNNIINEFEKEIKWQRKICLSLNNYGVSVCDILLNKLQELKGVDKE